jgi:hypothetical protein
MNRPHLVLQYPDLQSGKIRLLATTSDKKALAVFKKAVLEEARLSLLCCNDDILRIEYRAELHKLENLLNTLIPDVPAAEGPSDQ